MRSAIAALAINVKQLLGGYTTYQCPTLQVQTSRGGQNADCNSGDRRDRRVFSGQTRQEWTSGDGSDIAIVTDGSPMTRTWLLTSYLGHHKAQLVTVDLFTKFSVKRRRTMIMREAAAWWYNLGKIMVWEALSLFRIPPEMRTRLVN